MIKQRVYLGARASQISALSSTVPVPYRSFTTSRRWQDVFHSQAEDPSSSAILSSLKAAPRVAQTLTEKIVQRYSVDLPEGKIVKAGDYVTISPHHCMTHDNSWPVAKKFFSIGATKVYNNRQIVMSLDHDVQNKSESNLKKYRQIEEFASQQAIDFYGAGIGIGHQIMIEEGYAWPGTMTVASDSHSNMEDLVANTSNRKRVLPRGVTGKDVIIALCGLFNNDEVLNHAIEFQGPERTLRSLPVDDRLAIANMTTEWGALSGLFPVDSMLVAWMRAKSTASALFDTEDIAQHRFSHARIDDLIRNQLAADQGATYAKSLYLDLSTVSPYVSGPNSVKVATPLRKLEPQNIKINKAYLVSCTNSRASDLAAAAKVFRDAAARGKTAKIADGVKLYVAAASLSEQKSAEDSGDWQVLLDAGGTPLISGCGPCIGLGTGLLEPGEVGISASNRNFKNRMGSVEAEAYLASPEVVASSALSGKISGPGWYEQPVGVEKVILGEGSGIAAEDQAVSVEEALDRIIAQANSLILGAEKTILGSEATGLSGDDGPLTEILPGFPEKIEGEIVFCDANNVNTDGIYPGKYTYQDDVSIEKMGEVCMENYDPSFGSIAREGDILVSGFSFGCGSSREQAATAILAKKIPLVVAGSFGNIFSRNSINNALMGVEVPRLIQRLRETFPTKVPTRRTGWKLVWDVRRSLVEVTEGDGTKWSQKVGSLPPNVQSIIALGGLEKWVKHEIGEA